MFHGGSSSIKQTSEDFWKQNSTRHRGLQEDYKTMSEFYLTSNLIQRNKDRRMNEMFHKKLIKDIQKQNFANQYEVMKMMPENVTLEKNIFNKKFIGPNTVRDTIKHRI